MRSAAANGRDRLHRRAQIRRHRRENLVADDAHDRELIARAILDWLQPHVDVAQVARLRRVAPNRYERVVHFGQPLPDGVGDSIGDDLGALEARAFRRAQVDLELGLIVLGHEVLVGHHEERRAREEHEHGQAGDDPAMGHRPLENAGVEDVDGVEDSGILRRVPLVLRCSIDLEPARGQHWCQREADDQRNHDRERHRQAEALHEPADDSAHETDGHEDGDERQRRGQHGEPDFLRGVDGGLELVFVLFFDEPIDVLEDDDRVVDDDAHRERERQHRHEVEREAHVPDEPERRDDRRRNGDGRDDGRAKVGQEEEYDQRRQDRSDDKVFLDVVNRRLDEVRGVAHDARAVADRQASLEFLEARSNRANDLDGVGTRLTANLQEHRARAIDVGHRLRLGFAVFHARDVADSNGVPLLGANDDVAELGHVLDSPSRAERHRLLPLVHAPARNFDVLGLKGAGDVRHGQVVRAQARAVEPDVDLARPAAQDEHLTDTAHAFELPPENLVRVLGDIPDRAIGAEREAQDGSRVRIEPVHSRLLNRLRQEWQDAVDLVPNLLRRDVGILLEQEADHHLRHAFRRDRTELVDAADGVDGLLDLVADLGFDLLRRSARLNRGHDDGGEVDFRKAINAQQGEGEHADNRQRENEDAREHRTFDAESCQPLHTAPKGKLRMSDGRLQTAD